MPIQVNEIIIRAIVTDGNGSKSVSQPAVGVDREGLIAECVEQVLEILREKGER